MAQAKLGFYRLSVGNKILTSRYVVNRMTGNANFPTPTPDLVDVTAATDTLETAAQEALKGGTDKTTAKLVAESNLVQLMGRLLEYVNMASFGDPLVIESSGMDVQRSRVSATTLGQVQNVKAKVGGNPKEIIITWDGLVGSKGYVVEMKNPAVTTGGSSVPSSDEDTTMVETATGPEWLRIDTVSKRKLIVKNLETGTVYSFRVAAFNAAGQGDYSQVSSSVAP